MCNWRLKFSEPNFVVKINNFVKPETVRGNGGTATSTINIQTTT